MCACTGVCVCVCVNVCKLDLKFTLNAGRKGMGTAFPSLHSEGRYERCAARITWLHVACVGEGTYVYETGGEFS